MKVLQIANGYLGNRLYRELFQRFRNQGINQGIFVPMPKNATQPVDEPEDVVISRCFSKLDRLFFYSKQKKILQSVESHWDLSTVDLIHAHTVFSGGYSAWKLHQKYHIPYVVAVRNTDKNIFFRYMIHLRNTGVRIMQDAAAVIFLSPAYRDVVIKTYVPKQLQDEIRAKSLVIPNGISNIFVEDRCPPHTLTGNGIRLIYVGELNDNKNIGTTISAMDELHRQGISATLTVAGAIKSPKYEGYFDGYSFVTYLGKIPPEQVKEVMRQSDIFVMPSHMETFGLVYAEAMSQGLPVLYTRGQGFDGHFPDGTVGYSVDDCDPKDVAAKIKAIMSHYDQLAQNAYEQSVQFSWDRITHTYVKLYREVFYGAQKMVD